MALILSGSTSIPLSLTICPNNFPEVTPKTHFFGLKNARATYQRVATALFHDMMHKEVEVYVDDMIVKSEIRDGHFEALDKFLARLKKYNLRLNPKKCVFG